MTNKPFLFSGASSALILATAISCFLGGMLTALSEVSSIFVIKFGTNSFKTNLSTKAAIIIPMWLASWLYLYLTWRHKNIDGKKIYNLVIKLIIVGLIGALSPYLKLLF